MIILFLIGGAALAAAAIFLCLWPWRRKHQSSQALAWELIDNTPTNRQDLIITASSIALLGREYEYIASMPVNFICCKCNNPDGISLQLYRHSPSNTMILISQHHCAWLKEQLETVDVSAVRGGVRVQNSSPVFRGGTTPPRGGGTPPRGSGTPGAYRPIAAFPPWPPVGTP